MHVYIIPDLQIYFVFEQIAEISELPQQSYENCYRLILIFDAFLEFQEKTRSHPRK